VSLDVTIVDRRGDGWSGNVTHNLVSMAAEAGVYDAVWRPDEHGLDAAAVLTAIVDGIATLLRDRERFERHNPTNGWGDYDGLVMFLVEYALELSKYPGASIEVSR
jgi:hypothetical protein